MIDMEPMPCAVDEDVLIILRRFYSREVIDQLLYDGPEYVPITLAEVV